MGNLVQQDSLMEKLAVLADAAKFDVACTSSGVQRAGDGISSGSARASGVCHAFTGDGRCISLLKILYTNECIYNCKYCINRSSNDGKRVSFTPEEICQLTVEFYRRNYIEGLFLSSGIVHSPDVTMGLLYETLFLLRGKYRFNGYVHVKAIPGASASVLESVGYLADRMSVNLEFATAAGLRMLAPNKMRGNILTPMRQIQSGIKESRMTHGITDMKSRAYLDERTYYEQLAEIRDSREQLEERHNHVAALCGKAAERTAEKQLQLAEQKEAGGSGQGNRGDGGPKQVWELWKNPGRGLSRPDRYFVPAGQSTQMIVGAADETDYEIMAVSETLYDRFELKRVFYSAFVNVNHDSSLPEESGAPGLLREHRLYQADFLLRFYGFRADELLSEQRPNLNVQIDPKCDWAVRHLEQFPVEVNRADYYTLLRVPGIGTKSAKRILQARRHAQLDFSDIKKMGVVLKRALYFITCKGRMMYPTKLEEDYITRHLIYGEAPAALLPAGSVSGYEQISLWDYAKQMEGARGR